MTAPRTARKRPTLQQVAFGAVDWLERLRVDRPIEAFVALVAAASGFVIALAIVEGYARLVPFLLLLPLIILVPRESVVAGVVVLLSTSSWLDYRLFEGQFENVITIPMLIALALLLLWVLSLALRRFQVVLPSPTVPIGAFLAANFISTAWNYPGLQTRHMILGNLLNIMNFAIFFMVASIVSSGGRTMRRIVAIFLLGIGAGALAAGLIQVSGFLQSSRAVWKTNPAYTESLEKGALGGFGAMVGLMAIAFTLEAKRAWHRLCSLPFVVLGAGIDLLAWQRVQFVALFAGVVVVFVIKGWKYAALLVAAIALVVLLSPGIPGLVEDVFTFQMVSFDTRVDLWEEAYHVWMSRPLVGIGPSQFRQGISWTHPHNQYLTVAAETGTLGLGAFVALICVIGWESLRTYRGAADPMSRALSLGVAAVVAQQAVAGLAEGSFLPIYGRSQFAVFAYGLYFWTLVGLMIGYQAEWHG